MVSAPPDPRAGGDHVAATLRPLLAEQLRRLRRRYLWHGTALLAAAVGLLVGLFFGLDHWLRLPLPIRLLHTAAIGALAIWVAHRHLRYPLTRPFGDVELAAWIEATFPELNQRLVSALQLRAASDSDLRNQSSAMIDRVVADATEGARRLPLDRLFDARRTLRFAAVASVVVLLLTVGAFADPATARAFVLRHLGFSTDYPRLTTLIVELPPAGQDMHRRDTGDVVELMLPAGADLHVSVLAEGTVPKDVFLDVTPQSASGSAGDARSIAMSPRPGNRFRHVFRRLSGSFEFHARGGDDDRGDRTVIVRTVHPPQVATLAARVVPPAYTGVDAIEQTGGAIEALAGSEVTLTLSTTTAVQKAAMVFLESGRRLEMQPTTLQDDSATATVYRSVFALEQSDRYQIELVAPSGLRNPNPGTYPIAALQDYAPVGKWLLPDDEALMLLPNALLCVRLDVRDDFGLVAVDFAAERAGSRTLARSLHATGDGARPRTEPVVLTELVEVKDLLGAAANPGNDSVVLSAALRDNRAPQANTTELPHRIVQIVDAPQLASAIAKAFRALREEVDQALEIQTDRRTRLQDLLGNPAASPDEIAQVLTGAEVGQGRVNGTADRAHRALMRAFDVHLWNRLEQSPNAATVVDLYREWSRTLAEPVALDPAFYRDLQRRRTAGTLGGMETTLDPILAMIGLADRLTTTSGPDTSRLLSEAQVARGADDRQDLIGRTIALQTGIEQSLQQLLSRLEEWNDYQDLIQETRALRDRQRDLQGRTDDARGRK